jgi:hypothetical protein
MGLDWRVDYLPGAVTLTVLPISDFNRDGKIDAADYVVWRKNGGTVDQYNLWRATFGTTTGSGAGAVFNPSTSSHVPEPATALMLILGAGVVSWRGLSIGRSSR